MSSFWAGSRLHVEYTRQGLGTGLDIWPGQGLNIGPGPGRGLVLIGCDGGNDGGGNNDDDDDDDDVEEEEEEELTDRLEGRSNRKPFTSSCRCSITTDSLVR